MSPAHNFVISLPIVSTHQVCAQKFSWPKVRINLALSRNEIKLSTAGTHCHNHHAITYDWVPNFRVCLFPLPSPGLQPHSYSRCRQGRHVWQSQEATPGSWLARCTPHALGFSREQSTKYSEYLLENMQGSLRWSRNSRAYIGIFPYWFSIWQINFSWMVLDRSWNTVSNNCARGFANSQYIFQMKLSQDVWTNFDLPRFFAKHRTLGYLNEEERVLTLLD